MTARAVKDFAPLPAASWTLLAAGVLLPLGFLLGGIVIHDGDPGLGVLLVPVGALALLHGVARIARDLGRVKRT